MPKSTASALRRIDPKVLKQLKELLADSSTFVTPITVEYKDYLIGNIKMEKKSPLEFQWTQAGHMDQLFFGFYTWDTVESKKYPDTFLALGTHADFRLVGFPLYLLPQDKDFVYLSFKLGNNEGGKNRWFGRGRSAKESRSVEQTDQLSADIRQALQKAFPNPVFAHPTLSGEWLVLARLPLAYLKPDAGQAQRAALKTLALKSLLQAFVIAEKLRDDSLKAAGMPVTEDSENDSPPTPPATMDFPRNQILYGPPGTGKTYHTATRAVGILEELTDAEVTARYDRPALRARFDKYQQLGRVGFVTFHQAFGYEDFVEGIKPNVNANDEADGLRYSIEPGIFRTMADAAAAEKQRAQQPQTARQLPFQLVYDAYLADLQQRIDRHEGRATLHTIDGVEVYVSSTGPDGSIYIGHQNSAKPARVMTKWQQAAYAKFAQVADIVPMNATMRALGGPNASLQWAIFSDLKQFEAQNNASLQAAASATDDTLGAPRPGVPRFVLVIDEINRGNVANIFGELITLLEDDKRAGQPEALTVKLPYSKEDFTVPDNLYLLGTMNTADRSVEALDTALRRRFSFSEMRPEADVIRRQVGVNGSIGAGDEAVDLALILEAMNSRLEQLLDRDHCLGHALLLPAPATLADLCEAFERKILPLLQEYFFGDFGKIGLVLGPDFVEVVKANAPGRYALAKLPGYDATGLSDKRLYRLADLHTRTAAHFQRIYATPTA